jgi:hypothetical protein
VHNIVGARTVRTMNCIVTGRFSLCSAAVITGKLGGAVGTTPARGRVTR